MMTPTRFKIAILDDYQNVALSAADWSAVASRADITVFTDHVSGHDRVVKRLESFDVVCVMRERTPLPRAVIQRLPRLKLIASTGSGNSSIDVAAAQERGIRVTHSGYRATAAIELTWALILAGNRHLVEEAHSIRAGGWQTTVGEELAGRVLGVLGLGNIGREVARIALAFGMHVIAWSQNDIEPLPADHPFRRLDNVLSTPHIGFVTQPLYQTFYGDAARAISSWLIEQSADHTSSMRARAASSGG
jgi:phosphoglycerate dehydrogenase-like enzyme